MRPERRPVPGLAREMEALEASLQRDPSSPNVMRVAEANWLLGRAARAVQLLEPLVQGFPALVAPRVLLAWSLEDCGKLDAAARLRQAVHDVDPANPHGEPRPVQEPQEDDPEDDDEAAEEAAEPEAALSAEELREVPPGPLYSATLAEIFARQGFQEKAIEIYRRLEAVDPGRADVRDRIRTLQEQVGGDVS